MQEQRSGVFIPFPRPRSASHRPAADVDDWSYEVFDDDLLELGLDLDELRRQQDGRDREDDRRHRRWWRSLSPGRRRAYSDAVRQLVDAKIEGADEGVSASRGR